MATEQSGKNVIISYKAQAGLGTPATGAGGTGLQIAESPGFKLNRAQITDPSVRRDGQTRRPRLGSKMTDGSYNVPLRVGEIDTLFAALLRASATAAVNITEATMTSITTTTSTIVAAAGSWLTQGVRVGDLVKLTGHSTAANNGKWLRVLGVTANTITVPAASLTTDAVADTSFTLTIAKKIVSAATLTEKYFTFDEYLADIDVSDVFTDVKVSSFKLSVKPDGVAMCTFGLVGLDGTPTATGSSPTLTSPTFTTTLALELDTGKIAISGVDYADVSGVDLEYNLNGKTAAVLATTSPDVFLSNAVGTGTLTMLRPDSTQFTGFRAETQFSLFLHFIEPETDPADFVAFYLGSCIYTGQSNPKGNEGELVQTLPFAFGIDEDGGSSHDVLTSIKMVTSAA
jgi:hypothetical protein